MQNQNKRLVNCDEQFWDFVRKLRNDERVQNGFIQNVIITEEDQKSYMNKYHQFYRVGLIDNNPAGYIGVIDDDIRICVHPNYQKQGLGKFMLNEIMKEFPNAFGKVKIDNIASKKLFESCGFVEKYIIYEKN